MPLTVFELRNYTTRPGRRDALIALFEAEFIESQEALGAFVCATFRDLDDPNRFVWMRGFADMEARAAALDGFYTSALWRTHRNAANATMVDTDDVLQLKPHSGDITPKQRAAREEASPLARGFVAATYLVAPGAEQAFSTTWLDEAGPRVRDAGGAVVASFLTDPRPNSYPRLPIREGENVFVALTRFSDAREVDGALFRAPTALAPPHVMRLQPTARSALR